MSLSHAMLAFAKERPRYPYAMMQAFDEVFGDFWPLNYGQVHQTLEALTRKGLLAKAPDPEDASRNVYAITSAGEAALEEWKQESGGVRVRALRDEIFLRLHLQGRDAGDTPFKSLVEEYRIRYSKHLRELSRERSIQDRSPLPRGVPVDRLLLEAAIEHAEADVRWLDRVALALDGGLDFAAEAKERIRREESQRGGGASESFPNDRLTS